MDVKNWIKNPVTKLVIYNVVMLGVGIAALWNYQSFPQHFDELGRDVGIACIVAVLITITYEAYAREAATRETMEKTLERILGDLIDQAVWRELKEQILDKSAVRRRAVLKLTLTKANLATGTSNLLVLESAFTYDLESLRSSAKSIRVLHFLDAYMSGMVPNLPRFNRVSIGGKLLQLAPGTLTIDQQENLAARGKRGIHVEIEREELVYLPGAYNFILSELTELERIVLVGIPAGVKVVVNCMLKDRVLNADDDWLINQYLLPGQCLEIRFLPS